MKRQPFFRLVALMLALALVLGYFPAVSAAPAVNLDRSHRLVQPQAEAGTEAYKSTDSIRVSIILEEPSVAEKGFSTQAVASNEGALAHHAALNRSQQTMAAAISRQALGGKKLDVVWNLTLVANLISANVPYGSLDAIRAMDGVREVVIERQYSPDTAEQQTYSSAEMVGATQVWNTGYTGAGSRIAIVDTGTDTDHQSFDNGAYLYALERNAAEQGMSLADYKASLNLLDAAGIKAVLPYLNATERIGAQASEYYISEKLPFGANYVDCDLNITHDYDDQGSHGSHVAGIAAANRFLPEGAGYADAREKACMSGVAPDAQIITLKVFGNAMGPYDSDYFAAIEDAIWLGCDSVNLSLGAGDPGRSGNDMFAELLDFLATTDTVVVMSAGNSGYWAEETAYGYLYEDGVSFHTGGAPGTYTNSLSVASVDNDGTVGKYFSIAGRKVAYTETEYKNKPMSSLDQSNSDSGMEYDYVFIDGIGAEEDYAGLDVRNKVVFCSRGETSFYEKANLAASKGAAAVVIYNNTDGPFGMDLTDYKYTAPCVSITQADAAWIKANGDGTMRIFSNLAGTFYDSEYYTMSAFSSWGVPGSLELKPEITAPGGNIWSVNGMDTSGTAYELMSGTSMAAPQVTGMAALVAEYIRANGLEETTGESVRHLAQSLLMSTAVPMLEKDSGSYYSVLNQGAGLARVDLATTAESYITVEGMADGKVKVELGEDPGRRGIYECSFTIHNFSSEAMSYDLWADLFTQDVFDGGSGTMFLDTWTRMLGSEARFSSEDAVLEGIEDAFVCDLNGDGITNTRDADHLLEYVVGNVTELKADGDLNGDNQINSYDAHVLLNKLASQGSGNRVTVPAGEDVTIDVELVLTEETRAFLEEAYSAGAYIEGYVFAEPDGGVAHSIPVLGYYGSWTDPSMFDVGSWAEYANGDETRAPYLYQINGVQSNFVSIDYGDGDAYLFGGNPITQEAEYLPRRNAFNNTKGYMLQNLYYTLIRNAEYTMLTLKNVNTGEILIREELDGSCGDAAYYHVNAGAWQNTRTRVPLGLGLDGITEGTELELELMAVPELYMTGEGVSEPTGEGAYLSTTFTIDNTAPELLGYSQEDSTLLVRARDNEYIAAVALLDSTGSTIVTAAPGNQTQENTVMEIPVDLSAVFGKEFILAVYDYAENVTAVPVELELDNQRPRFTAIDRTNLNDDGTANYVGLNADGTAVMLAPASGREPARAAAYVEGYVFEISDDNILYVGSNEELYSFTEVCALDPNDKHQIVGFNDLAYNKADGKLYGLFYSEKNNMTVPYLCTIDLFNGSMDVLGEMPIDANTLAIDGKGNFYSGIYGASELYKYASDVVDTKKTTFVGEMDGYRTTDVNSMAWDHSTGELYWACSADDTTSLLKVDTATAVPTPVAEFSFHTAGLYIAWESGSDLFAPVNTVDSVALPGSISTLAGQSIRLYAKVLPWNISDASVTWTSSNPAVATVDGDGVVSGVAQGSAVITAASVLDPAKTASCTVTVTALDTELKAVIWDEEGQVHWASFRTDTLPDYKSLNAITPNLPVNATMVANGTLYASTLDTTNGVSDLYTVDPDTFAMTEVGSSSTAYLDMAYAPNMGYGLGLYFNYVVLIDLETGNYVGAWDWADGVASDLVGITYYGSQYNESYGAYMDYFLILDADGNVYLDAFLATGSSMGYFNGPTEGYVTSIGEPVDYSYFQGFYYDGAYTYWTRFSESEDRVELIAWDCDNTGESYSLGTFPEKVWPVGGLYTDAELVSANALIDGELAAASIKYAEPMSQIPTVEFTGGKGGLNSAIVPMSETEVKNDLVYVDVTLPYDGTNADMIVFFDTSMLELVDVSGNTTAFAWKETGGRLRLSLAEADVISNTKNVARLTFKPLAEGETLVSIVTGGLGDEGCGYDERITVTLPHICPSERFVDVHQYQWFHEAVDYVVEKGYMNGMDGTHFGPDLQIKRSQFLTVLWRMAGSPETALTDKFEDVKPDQYYAEAVAWAVENNITSGMTPTRFEPDGELTRAQLVTFMYRYAGFKGCDTSATAQLDGYDDADTVSEFAREPMRWALTHGIITGVTAKTLVPEGKATRAQAATIFQRFDQKMTG